MNVVSQSPVHLVSGMQSEAINSEAEVDASLIRQDEDEATAMPQGFRSIAQPNRAARRRLAWQARTVSKEGPASQNTSASLASRAAEVEEERTKTAHDDGSSDATNAMAVRVPPKLSTSALERFERLIDQAQARPQLAVGLVAAAAIMVTTLVWSKAGRLVLLAAGGYVADRAYGKQVKKAVKRMTRRLPAKLTR